MRPFGAAFEGVACNIPNFNFVDASKGSGQLAFRSRSMLVVVYDDVGEVAFRFETQRDTLALCPGRLEKAHVVEALQEAAFFIMDGLAPPPDSRAFRRHVFEGDDGE
jgi:hypothetical protein